MCGRYTAKLDERQLWQLIEDTLLPSLPDSSVDQLDLFVHSHHRQRYNVVPTDYIPVLLSDPEPHMDMAHWWLLPEWAGPDVRFRTSQAGTKSFRWIGPPKSHFNSKYATLTEPKNRYWSKLLGTRRCLVPGDGFIEWPDKAMLKPGQEYAPRYFFLKDGKADGPAVDRAADGAAAGRDADGAAGPAARNGGQKPFFFAGIYDIARDDEGRRFLSANLITVEPNELVSALPHHRMPAILADGDAAAWLSPDTDFEGAKALLRTYPAAAMDAYTLSDLANKAVNDSPEVLLPRAR